MSVNRFAARREVDRRREMDEWPSAVVHTPHGVSYLPPVEDYPDAVVAAQDRWFRRVGAAGGAYCREDTEGCGRHSGIPACCRAWWHQVWSPRGGWDPRFPRPSWWLDEWGYIACPGCRQCGARIRVQPCPPASLEQRAPVRVPSSMRRPRSRSSVTQLWFSFEEGS
jgi:hypothetical protein